MKQETKRLLDEAAEEEGQIDWGTVLNSISNGDINPRDVNYIVEAAITRAIESAKPKWISVEDGLPTALQGKQYSATVFVVEKGGIYKANYNYKHANWVDLLDLTTMTNVTHWMPLFELPEK